MRKNITGEQTSLSSLTFMHQSSLLSISPTFYPSSSSFSFLCPRPHSLSNSPFFLLPSSVPSQPPQFSLISPLLSPRPPIYCPTLILCKFWSSHLFLFAPPSLSPSLSFALQPPSFSVPPLPPPSCLSLNPSQE